MNLNTLRSKQLCSFFIKSQAKLRFFTKGRIKSRLQYYIDSKMDALGITQQISNYIIRPPRTTYTIDELGQSIFEYKSVMYCRTDFQVPASATNLQLECSLYSISSQASKSVKNIRPTVIYLHANSSSRVTVKNYLKNLIEHFDVVAFDFRGCGISQGKYLTLGYLQKFDLKAVIEYVQAKFGARKFMLWGRSMGAVTAILYTSKFQLFSDKIWALVLDSPFSDLQKIIHFLADKKAPLLPTFMIESIIQNLQKHIQQKIKEEYGKQFLIRKHKPINEISNIRVPIFFIGSKSDELVDSKHLQSLYDKAVCQKEMEVLEGGHNQVRPQHLKLAVVEFLVASLTIKREPVVRKRIFEYPQRKSINSPQNVTVINQGRSNGKDRLKSKSANKNRLFRLESMPLRSGMGQGPREQKQEDRKQTERTHAQILNKVLPQNSTRRNNRIFNNVGKGN